DGLHAVGDLPEGADRQRATAFERYATRVAAAWSQGTVPSPPPGLLSEVSVARAPRELPQAVPPWAAPPTDRAKAPWVRTGLRSRWTLKLWPALWIGPVVAVLLSSRALGHAGSGFPPWLGAVALGASG